jgi:hypothetical protein
MNQDSPTNQPNSEPNFIVKQKRPKNAFKPLAIVLIVVVVALAATAGVFGVKFMNQRRDIDHLKNQVTQLQTSAKGGQTTDNSTTNSNNNAATKKSFTSSLYGLTFDYPANWTVGATTTQRGQDAPQETDTTVVTTAGGYKILLTEGYIDGLGGTCDPSSTDTVSVHKEATSVVSGLSVISTQFSATYNNVFDLQLSSYSGPFDTPTDSCPFILSYPGLIKPSKFGVTDSSGAAVTWISFSNVHESGGDGPTTTKPSDTEYPQIVAMLASLRKN